MRPRRHEISIMLGLGEERDEIVATLRDLRAAAAPYSHARQVPAPIGGTCR